LEIHTMSIFEAAIWAVPAAMIAHLAIGFVLKYPQWKANGRTFHPPAPEPTPAPDPVVDELPLLPDLMEHAAALVVKPIPEVVPVAAVAAAMSAPVAIAVEPVEQVEVVTEPDNYQGMTSAQLRKECSRHGIQWRNARGEGKHLTKPQMLAELKLVDL
jgi:hypothetical protein